jgi:hypothetical protein
MSAQYFELVIWSLGCVSALGAAWVTDRRENRESVRRFNTMTDLVQDKINDLFKRVAVLENKVDEWQRRVDRE